MREKSDRIASADRARRRATVSALSVLLTALTVAVVPFVVALDGPTLTISTNTLAIVGFALPFFLARRGHVTIAATMLLATMLLQHVGSALANPVLSQRGLTMMFSGLTPLIAAVLLTPREAGVVTASAATAVGFVWALTSAGGIDPVDAGRAFGPAMFFVAVAGVVAITSSLASSRALSAHRQDADAGALARSEADAAKARLRSIADQVSDLVAVLDSSGRYVFASASYDRVLGLHPEDLLGTTSPEIVHDADRGAFAAAFRASFEGEPEELTGRLRTKDETFRTFHARMVGVSIDHVRYVVITSRDVTELEKLNGALEGARRMESLGRLAGGVAHDFNNLLAVIHSCTSILRAEQETPYDPDGELGVIEQTVERANELTEQLLSFAQRQVTAPEGTAKPYEVLERMLPLLKRAVGKSVDLAIERRESSTAAHIAASQLEQILLNLAVNARDAMPKGGALTVSVGEERLVEGQVDALEPGVYAVLSVKDEGTGMSPDVALRVFEPFFTTKTSGKGTGLGLATCFGIARQRGGTMTVASRVGLGTTFRTYIPSAEADSSSEHTPSPPTEQAPPMNEAPKSLSTLVVDDEPMICRVVARTLAQRGHHVTSAGTAREAREEAGERLFDVIIADLSLGADDGLALLAELREIQPNAGLIIMSGQAPSREQLDALDHSTVEILSKPFTMEALAEAVLRTAHSQREPASPLGQI